MRWTNEIGVPHGLLFTLYVINKKGIEIFWSFSEIKTYMFTAIQQETSLCKLWIHLIFLLEAFLQLTVLPGPYWTVQFFLGLYKVSSWVWNIVWFYKCYKVIEVLWMFIYSIEIINASFYFISLWSEMPCLVVRIQHVHFLLSFRWLIS